ncbi:hypothetical protein AB28_0597 [Raoultella ornithinolytica 2-156-04_S1_C2]|nr:hypothetical protein AB00_0590 [Raoultella ornithinolytica 2-156-04_S1_C1]KDX15846.1 hypothetical protein AB28_0597 [Raoultella ornithinolytica 2-156-04_S1_C2]
MAFDRYIPTPADINKNITTAVIAVFNNPTITYFNAGLESIFFTASPYY